MSFFHDDDFENGTFTRAVARDEDLSEKNFSGCTFESCDFESADFLSAIFE
jgi:uncharacterized protein YjbI with pentapeptide repeats